MSEPREQTEVYRTAEPFDDWERERLRRQDVNLWLTWLEEQVPLDEIPHWVGDVEAWLRALGRDEKSLEWRVVYLAIAKLQSSDAPRRLQEVQAFAKAVADYVDVHRPVGEQMLPRTSMHTEHARWLPHKVSHDEEANPPQLASGQGFPEDLLADERLIIDPSMETDPTARRSAIDRLREAVHVVSKNPPRFWDSSPLALSGEIGGAAVLGAFLMAMHPILGLLGVILGFLLGRLGGLWFDRVTRLLANPTHATN